jgi:ectoine hydroxylase-related dioxygenase (phytanoyl-CoA dioxygenase family)
MGDTDMQSVAEKPAADSARIDSVGLITKEVIEQYQRDGVVFLPKALHAEWIKLIDLGIDRVLASPSPNRRWFHEGQPGAFQSATRDFDSTPEYQRLLYDSPIADMISRLIDSPEVWLLFDHTFVKEGGAVLGTPWHQDLPYWPVAGEKIASMWANVHPVPKSECLEFVKGSHLWPMFDPARPEEAVDGVPGFYGKAFPPMPDIDAERDNWDIATYDIEPGDVVLFHPNLLHGGGPTVDGQPRRTISIRIYGDDIVYAERPDSRPTIPPTPGLSLALKPGDPLRHPYYPKLRPVPEHLKKNYL